LNKVMKYCNSYGESVSRWHRILRILESSDRPLSPKEIAFHAKINHSTVRVYLRQMLKLGDVSQPSYGYYVRKTRLGVGVGFGGVRVHGLVLVVDAPFLCERPKIEDVKETVGGVRFEVRFGRRNGKISCWIGCDPPGLDYQSCVFAIKHFQRIVWDQVGFRVTEFETVNCDFNEDYIGVQLDGVKSVTVRDFLGNLERIYNKGPNVVRSEVRFPAEKMTIESMLTLLKGGITPYNILQTQFALLKKIENLYEAIKFGNEVNYRILTFLKDMMEKRR